MIVRAWIGSLVLCMALAAGCGTINDYRSKHGPHVYGGVGVSFKTLGRSSLIDNPFVYVYRIIDVPLSLVTDTLTLPITLASASSRSPEEINQERLATATTELVDKLIASLPQGTHKVGVLDFSKDDERAGRDHPMGKQLSADLRASFEASERITAVISAAKVREAMEESGFETVEQPLAVRSVAEELEVSALVVGVFELKKFGQVVILKVSIRSGETGNELKSERVEIELLELEKE